MPAYKLYEVGENGRSSDPPKLFDALSDTAAIKIASGSLTDCDLELWEGERLVITLVRSSKP